MSDRSDCSGVVVGSAIVITRHGLEHFGRVTSVKGKTFFVGTSRFRFDGLAWDKLSKTCARRATPREVVKFEQIQADIVRARQRRAEYESREEVKLAGSLASWDREAWLKCNVEELRMVTQLMNERNPRKQDSETTED